MMDTTTCQLPPVLPLEPNRVWRTYLGGRVLDQWEGKPNPTDSHFPEDWIGSVVEARNIGRESHVGEGLSAVVLGANRPLLRDLMEQQPDLLLGASRDRSMGAHAGFLMKLLDSSIRLHIQAHPTRAFSRRHLNSNFGKTEAYVILETRPEVADPCVYFGFQRPPDRQDYREAIVRQNVPEILAPFEPLPVKPGDVFLVPGGVPHAIGAGVLMVEVMEPTDFAVRLEFERGGYPLPESARFMGRDVDFALDMIDFSPLSHDEIRQRHFGQPRVVCDHGQAGCLWSVVDQRLTDCFQIHQLRVNERIAHQPDGFQTFLVTAGSGRLEVDDFVMPLSRGSRGVVPACTRQVWLAADQPGLELVLVSPSTTQRSAEP